MSNVAEKQAEEGQQPQAQQLPVESKGKGKHVDEEEDEEDDEEDEEYNDEEVGDDVVDDDLEEIDPSAIVETGSRRTRSKVDYTSEDARKKAELTDKEEEDDDVGDG
ncbi:hypothetical protein E3P99_02305 [Wallemia hederae]|uniref:Histone chaperone domain-containing protein n=1 Tax=Wallemia hederae TaxID=1540922 RepID=A0A4T0FME0_9BASI|nr:hypothetical protein E3P99_02305 [Wallemia hederae]